MVKGGMKTYTAHLSYCSCLSRDAEVLLLLLPGSLHLPKTFVKGVTWVQTSVWASATCVLVFSGSVWIIMLRSSWDNYSAMNGARSWKGKKLYLQPIAVLGNPIRKSMSGLLTGETETWKKTPASTLCSPGAVTEKQSGSTCKLWDALCGGCISDIFLVPLVCLD